MNDLINCSTRPSCNPNTYLSNKKKRFENWLQVPDTMHQELTHWKERAKASETSYRSYIEAKESWLHSFDSSRKLLCDKLDNISKINKKMRMESKLLTSIVLQHTSRTSKAVHHDIDHGGKNNEKNKKQVYSNTNISDHQVNDDDDDDDDDGCVANDASRKRKSNLQLSDLIHDSFERRDSINNILRSYINEAKTSSSNSSSSNHDLKSKNKVIDDADGLIKKVSKSKKTKNNKNKHVVDNHTNSKTDHHHRNHHHHHVLMIDEMDYYAIDFKYINPKYKSMNNNNNYSTTVMKKMKTSDDKDDSGRGDDDESNHAVLKDGGIEEEGIVQANIDNNNINNNINIGINNNDVRESNEDVNDDKVDDIKSDGRVDGVSNEFFTNDYICDHLQLQYFDAITKEVLPAVKPISSSNSTRVVDDHHRSLHHDDTVDDDHDHHANPNQHRDGSKAIGIVTAAAASDTTDTIVRSRASHSLHNDDNNRDVIVITPQQCIELFCTLHESIRRSESILGDVDFMFQQDNRLLNDMMLIKSIVKDDKIASSLYASTATTSSTTANATNDATLGDSNTTHNTNYQANNINSDSGDVVRAPSLSLLPTKSEQQSIVNIYSLLDNKHTSNLNYWGTFLHLFFNSTVNTVEHSSSITTRKKKRAINIELSQVTANARSRTPREVPLIISPLSQYEDRYIGNKNEIVSNNNSCSRSSSRSSLNVDTELFRCIAQAEDECIQRCFLHTYSAMSDLKIRRLKVIQNDSFKLMQDAMSSVKKMELMYAHALQDSSQENQKIQSDLVYYGIIRSRDGKDHDGDVHQVDGDNNPDHHYAHSQDSVSVAHAYSSTGSTMLEGMISVTTNDQSTDDSKKRSLFQSSYGPFTKRRK